ncbi:MAG: hypothetical protein QOE51_4025, partial [Actinoplanes sp.]|nr:hypothetical protein [Actinoplanes sp.]
MPADGGGHLHQQAWAGYVTRRRAGLPLPTDDGVT